MHINQEKNDKSRKDVALITSELRYRRLFETAQDGILLIDFTTGMILDVNKYLIDMLGYSKKTFLKKHLWEVGIFKDVAASKKNFATLQKKRYVRFEDLPLETKKGKEIDVEFVANAYQVNNDTIIQCNIRNITDRKKAEYTAQVSELRYRRLFETAQDGILLIDYDTGMILDVNSFLINLLNYPKAYFLKKHLWEIGVFKDIAASKKNFTTLQSNKYIRYEDLPLETKDGRKVNVEFVSNAYHVDGMIIIQCNIRDITDRKKREFIAEKSLRESEEKFSKAFKTSPYAITITHLKNGKFIEVNDTFVALSGYTRKEALASSSLGLKLWVNEKDRQFVIDSLSAGKPIVSQEYLFKKRDGDVLIGLFSAQILSLGHEPCLLSSISDITDRKRAEQLVNEIKTRDEAILKSIGDAVFATDKEGKILVFNKVAEEMTGISVKEAVGRNFKDIITFIRESDGKPSSDFITKAIEYNKITKMTNHVLLVRKDGSTVPVADSAAPIENDEDKLIGCVVVFHDVSREREIDKAKTELVSLASHQLRTPLTALRWVSEVLSSEQDGALNQKQRDNVEKVHAASRRMIALVNALLNVSRLEMGTFTIEPQSVNIQEIFKQCMKELTPQILEKKLIFQENYDSSIPTIFVDPKLISIVIENLMSNAVKYTPNNGKISLEVKKEGDSVILKVSDTGVGIPENQQNKIFSKLFRADNAKEIDPDGAGLGLYIVKEIIDHSVGTIWFESQEGKGTTFYVKLPLSGMQKRGGARKLE